MRCSGYADRNDSDTPRASEYHGGAVFFIRRFLARKHEIRTSPEAPIVVPPIIRKLARIQLVMNSLGIVFGVSMLLPGLMPLPVVACILLVMGPLLFVLASLLRTVAIMEAYRRTAGNLITHEARPCMGAFGLH